MPKEEFPVMPGETLEEETHYKTKATGYADALRQMVEGILDRPASELSAQKIGIRAPSSFRAQAYGNLSNGVRFELNLIVNYGPPLPADERPSSVECSALEFKDRARECADALITTALFMMNQPGAGAFILIGGFRVAETSHNVEFSLKAQPPEPEEDRSPRFVRNDPATG